MLLTLVLPGALVAPPNGDSLVGVLVGVSVAGAVKNGMRIPAEEQSNMQMVGDPAHCLKSLTESGMYSV
jgi:hypothetical protein